LVPNLYTEIFLQKNNYLQCNLCKLLLVVLIVVVVVVVVVVGGGGGGGDGRRRKRSINNDYCHILFSYYHCSLCIVKIKSNCGLLL